MAGWHFLLIISTMNST